MILATAISARAQNSYSVHSLVSDLPGVADQLDANLKNPWGLSASRTSPFWISNNHTGTTTVYNTDGKPFPETNPLVVSIPAAGRGLSSPTGQAFNDTGSFELAPGMPAVFLFCTEDGTIAGWNSLLGPSALKVVDNSALGAVYKGIAVANSSDGPRLYVANFSAGKIEAFDGSFHPVPIPDDTLGRVQPGYAPFNIQRIGRRLYVTYALQNDEARDDVAGTGNGYVYVFTLEGHLVAPLIQRGALNSPWGLAVAPEYFGPFSQALLVANFGDGKINAYDSCSGQWLGALAGTDGADLVVPGLWALRTGNGYNGGEAGVLYFTAGIPGNGDLESHGLFGSIRPAPPAAPASTPPPSNFAVDIRNLRFHPDAITIPMGGVLTWTNGDGFAHTVKGDTEPFESGVLEPRLIRVDPSIQTLFATPQHPGFPSGHACASGAAAATLAAIFPDAAARTEPRPSGSGCDRELAPSRDRQGAVAIESLAFRPGRGGRPFGVLCGHSRSERRRTTFSARRSRGEESTRPGAPVTVGRRRFRPVIRTS